VDCPDAPPLVRKAFLKMLSNRKKAFADPTEALPYNTVVATIRTVDEKPIYAKLYPYPMGAADFVNGEIEDLLHNGIIQYNNPIWVVDKKSTDETGKRKMRLVLGFRKLNERTIPGRYPMPNKYHQITPTHRDREKLPFPLTEENTSFADCHLHLPKNN